MLISKLIAFFLIGASFWSLNGHSAVCLGIGESQVAIEFSARKIHSWLESISQEAASAIQGTSPKSESCVRIQQKLMEVELEATSIRGKVGALVQNQTMLPDSCRDSLLKRLMAIQGHLQRMVVSGGSQKITFICSDDPFRRASISTAQMEIGRALGFLMNH